MRTFRLNGIFLAIGESLSRPAGLTSARWQVLGAVLRSPLPVAGIAREMGLTRQSVQRNANLLVESGLAAYVENPAHRRAKLLTPTEAGRKAIRRIAVDQHEWARRLDHRIGEPRLRQALQILDDVIGALDPIATDPLADLVADPVVDPIADPVTAPLMDPADPSQADPGQPSLSRSEVS